MHLMLSCVSFEEVSQANETFNSGADGNLAKASEELFLSQTSRLRSRKAQKIGKKEVCEDIWTLNLLSFSSLWFVLFFMTD